MPETFDIKALAAEIEFAVDGHSPDAQVIFLASAMRAGLAHSRFDVWQTDVAGLDATDLELAMSQRDHDEDSRGLVLIDGAIANVQIRDDCVNATVAARTIEACDAALEVIRRALPPRRIAHDGAGTALWFWREGEYSGAEREQRVLDMPRWPEISANYAGETANLLDRLVGSGAPAENDGRAIVWHGEPGTGKTYALRALGREWRSWCDVHVVVDAERFLSHTGYMDEVLAHRAKGERWRLIALEDTGELLTADARERVGQGLSRLLNATDGLLGQGTRCLILITTNEPIVRLHPAISRPGRCLAEVEFAPLSADEANGWLAERCNERVEAAASIAELYEVASGRQSMRRRRLERVAVGFAARNGDG